MASTLIDNCAAYWTFATASTTDSWLEDKTGNGHTFTYYTMGGGSNPTQTTGIDGGSAVQPYLLADTSLVQGGLETPHASDISGLAATTWAAWIYPTGTTGTHAVIWKTFQAGNPIAGYALRIAYSGALWRAQFYMYTSGSSSEVVTNYSYSNSVWNLLVARFDPTVGTYGTIYLSVNGGAQFSAILGNTASPTTSPPLYLGVANNAGSGEGFPGKITDVGVWTRSITPSEITELYAGATYPFAREVINVGATVAPFPKHQFFKSDGTVANGYQLFVYEAGTSTKTTTYQDADLNASNTNPIVLDSAGRASIFLVPGLAYKFVFASPTDTDPPASPIWTVDNVTAVPGSSSNFEVAGTAGSAISANKLVYLSDGSGGRTIGRWYLADPADAYRSTNPGVMGFALSAIANGSEGTIRVSGQMTGLNGLSPGSTYYCSTAGAITSTAPVNNAQPIGVADSATSLIMSQWAPMSALHLNMAQHDGWAYGGNLFRDACFEICDAGTSAAPSHYALSGTGSSAAIVAGQIGAKAYKVISGLGDTALGYQTIISSSSINAYWKGQSFTIVVWGRGSTLNGWQPMIYDGVTRTSGAQNVGTSQERIAVSMTTSASATKLEAGVIVAGGGNNVIVDGWMLVRGTVAPQRFSPDHVIRASKTLGVVSGVVSTGTIINGFSFNVGVPIIVVETRLTVGTAPTGQPLIVDVNKNGTTMYTTKPQIAAGATTGSAVPDSATYATRCLTRGDLITFDVDQVGSGTAGSNLTVELVYRYHPPLLEDWVAAGEIGT